MPTPRNAPAGRAAPPPAHPPPRARPPPPAAPPLADPWIASTLAAASAPPPPELVALRTAARGALATARVPTNKVEAFRFTDVSALVASPLPPPPQQAATDATVQAAVASLTLSTAAATLVFVDGVLAPALCRASGLPAGVFAGDAAAAPSSAAATLGTLSSARGGPFALLNSGVATSAAAVVVEAGVTVASPIHVLHVTTATAAATPTLAAPRLVVHLAPGAVATLVEEYAALAPGPAAVAQVTEAVVSERASLTHALVSLLPASTTLVTASLIDQEAESTYSLVEARTGGALTRHDVDVMQTGRATTTRMRHYLLAADAQLHDLHTSLDLAHPDGVANQLHKCIAAAPTSRCVFDGGVVVRRAAQRTDAAQLSRNLLLARRATVNVKPNLRIVADDVKCTHGCAVSDLEEEALFYFLARGVDAATARRVLVDSFGAEVTAGLPAAELVARVAAASAGALAGVAVGGE